MRGVRAKVFISPGYKELGSVTSMEVRKYAMDSTYYKVEWTRWEIAEVLGDCIRGEYNEAA